MTSPSDAPVRSALAISAAVEDIAKVTSWLEGLEEEEDWPPALRFGLELSVEEALANVITHGFEGIEGAPEIRVEYFRPSPESVGIRIIDNGVAFDPTDVRAPDLAESVEGARIGGHGVRLMRHFLRDIAYDRAEGTNRLTLIAGPKPDA